MYKLAQKVLGSCGLQVSQLGLGTVKFGRNTGVKYPYSFAIPDDDYLKKLLNTAKEFNINLLDTAPAYGNSEDRLGKLLKEDRKDWIICSKVGEEFHNGESIFNFTKNYIIKSVERSLKRLNTDHLDILLIHSDGNDEEIINKFAVFEILQYLKQHGLIRSFGMSIKTVAGGLLTVKLADVVMLEYNINYLEQHPVIIAAAKNKKGVLIKKAFGSGHLAVKPNLELIFNMPGIHSTIIGTINLDHLTENVRIVAQLSDK